MTQTTGRNIASASWGDHLTFGEADGLLDTQDKLKRRMELWKDELGAGVVQWRHGRRTRKGRYYTAKNYRRAVGKVRNDMDWDDFDVMPRMAHEFGMEAYLYVSIFRGLATGAQEGACGESSQCNARPAFCMAE